jgi:hypothetical protein
MSSVYEDAHVVVLLSDYAQPDSSGKINALGLGFQVAGLQQNGLTAPQYVTVLIEVTHQHIGETFALSVGLRERVTGQHVKLPGPSGKAEPLRVQQICPINPPSVPGVFLTQGAVKPRINMALAFPNGLALPPGATYVWKVEIDGQGRKGWTAEFHVPGPPPQPVLGGTDNPEGVADLPKLDPPAADSE